MSSGERGKEWSEKPFQTENSHKHVPSRSGPRVWTPLFEPGAQPSPFPHLRRRKRFEAAEGGGKREENEGKKRFPRNFNLRGTPRPPSRAPSSSNRLSSLSSSGPEHSDRRTWRPDGRVRRRGRGKDVTFAGSLPEGVKIHRRTEVGGGGARKGTLFRSLFVSLTSATISFPGWPGAGRARLVASRSF